MRLLEVIAGDRLLARGARRRARPPAGRWASGSSTPPTGPASSSTAATAPSAWRRCALLQERVADVEDDRRDRARGGLPHGAVRAAGPRRDRRRLRGLALLLRAQLRRAALAALAAERADGGGRPPGPQDRPRLVRVPAASRAAEDPDAAVPGGRRGPARGRRRRPRRSPHELRALREPRRASTPAAGRGRGRGAVADRRLPAPTPRSPPLQGGPGALLCADGSLHGARRRRRRRRLPRAAAAGGRALVELTRGDGTVALAAERAEAFFARLGLRTAWVGDAPGLVLGRIVCPARQRGVLRRGRGRRHAPRTSTPAWSSASTTRAGRSRGATRSALDHLLADARRAARRARRGALSRRAAAAQAGDASSRAVPTAHLTDTPR